MSGRRGVISNRVTGYAFYGLVALWVVGIVAGMLYRLPYVEGHESHVPGTEARKELR